MWLTKLMVAGGVVCVASVLIVPVSARGHDITQDSRYWDPDDTAHECHHQRVFYWKTSSEIADGKIDLLRYHHAREKEEQPDAALPAALAAARKLEAEVKKEAMLREEQSVHAAERLLSTIEERARIQGCYPWP